MDAILNISFSPRVTKWHPTDLDSAPSNYPESVKKHCLYLNSRFSHFPPDKYPPSQDLLLCPVTTYIQVIKETPTRHPEQPMLVHPDTYQPVSAQWLTQELRHIIMELEGHNDYISLHSLCRSAASEAYQAGFSELQIQHFGTWSSAAYKRYVAVRDTTLITRSLIQGLNGV